MRKLEKLEPGEVFFFFEEICSIPHGSGNVDAISNYLKKFAEERNLFCIQDSFKNIIIVKEASKGYENQAPVMLQGHMDMVAVQNRDADIDMKKEGLRLAVKGDDIYAEGTSLGGDDGIAVAYALALLNNDELKHPRLEVVITVDEEVGMDGARTIDLSMLKSKQMINLDSEEEGIFWTSCAGGARVNCALPVTKEQVSGELISLKVDGLVGGHSGSEIDKEHGNSNCLMARVLWKLAEKYNFGMTEIFGGVADNAIPIRTEAKIILASGNFNSFLNDVDAVEELIKKEYKVKDPNLKITAELLKENENLPAVCKDSLNRALAVLTAVPNGVQAMSADIDGLVETSLNLGILRLDDSLHIEFSVRSALESAKENLIDKLKALMVLAGGNVEVVGDYPGWAYRQNSKLRDKMVSVYENMYGKKPEVAAIHAGLECGILLSKVKDLDCVSIGPDMKDIHTAQETLSISSTRRVWEFLVEFLQRKDI